jgi:hypothetical protein
MPPNGMAQRQRRDWQDTLSIMAHFWQIASARSAGAAVRLEPVLGGVWFYALDFGVRASASDCAGPTIHRINSCTTTAEEP